jgi:hypothetical protein
LLSEETGAQHFGWMQSSYLEVLSLEDKDWKRVETEAATAPTRPDARVSLYGLPKELINKLGPGARADYWEMNILTVRKPAPDWWVIEVLPPSGVRAKFTGHGDDWVCSIGGEEFQLPRRK